MSGVLGRPSWSMGIIRVLIAAALAAAISLSTAADFPVAIGDGDNSFIPARNETSIAFFKLAESQNLPADCKPRATHVAAVLLDWRRNFPTRQQRSADGLAYRA